jgi:hypothetical protein
LAEAAEGEGAKAIGASMAAVDSYKALLEEMGRATQGGDRYRTYAKALALVGFYSGAVKDQFGIIFGWTGHGDDKHAAIRGFIEGLIDVHQRT